MRAFWNGQLAGIAQISVPDPALVDAYKSGFITTQITRSGDDLDTGVNGYESEFSHDVIGILTNLFTQGYFTGCPRAAHRGPQRRRVPGPVRRRPLDVRGALGRVPDEDGRQGFVAQNFATEGPQGAAQPSIEDSAPTPSPPTGPGRWGRWRPPTTSTPRDTGPPTTTRRCSAWPPTATSPSALGEHDRGHLGHRAVRQPPGGGQHRARRRPSAATASTTCPARCSSPTPPTAAPTRATPTGPRPSASAAGPGRATCSAPR